MKYVGLVSGGKDSIHSICVLNDQGHELVALLQMRGNEEYSDSYMFQTVGGEFIEKIAEALGVPLKVARTGCIQKSSGLDYVLAIGDEVEDLFRALSEMKQEMEFDAVSSGAILSQYQKNRVDAVCGRLGLVSLSPLWKRNQRELLIEMIESGIQAKIVKIASPVFTKEAVGMNISDIIPYLEGKRANKYGEIHFCGEGGEYETAVVDCKYFKKRILAEGLEVFPHPEEVNKDGSVFYAKYSDIKLVPK